MFSVLIKTENSEYLHMYNKKILLSDALENAGIQEGDTVNIYDLEFDYFK